MNNLEFVEPDQFDVDPDCGIVDSRLMSPIARLALDAAHEYLEALSSKAKGCQPILDRIDDLQARTELVSVWFEKFLHNADDEGTPVTPGGD